ncbi:protein kinase domain-containing protein [Kineosporia babensis]|uniref:non-specific serine/threonine protein kinase n=1 Tax=Kineosporia babensis TaxID=499548 RepID=A0A9X1NLX9_9ACTN|nr:protein kinase [Kineosporia babensis]MCD5316520.1 protein kinase [Kineosporia babensis]
MSEQLGAPIGEVIPELDGLVGMEALASGGFSVIYRAFQPALNRTVAVKIMSADGVDRRDRERFSREMGLTGKLGTHPNIVDVYHYGLTRHGQPYLMMPWYEGGSLADGLRDSGPMPPAVLLRLAIKMASALGYAHQHGVLHRDVKPGNILLTALNEPVLADFGIAVDARQAGNATVAWTPNHAAPEVLSYEEPTAQSDLWALASTLYTALAGRPPYPVDPGNTLLSIQQRFRSAPPPFVRTDVPHSLSVALTGALAPAPADRPADMAEFIAGLQDVERELGLPVTVPPGLAPMPELSRRSRGPEPDTLVPQEAERSWEQPSQPASPSLRPEPSRGQERSRRAEPPQPQGSAPTRGSSRTPDDSWAEEPSWPAMPAGPEAFAQPGDPGGQFSSGPQLNSGTQFSAPERSRRSDNRHGPQQPAPEFRALLPDEGTQIPDGATVLGTGVRPREKKGWSWKRRLLTSTIGGLVTVVLVVVGLSFMADSQKDETPAPEETTEFVPPTVSGLQATKRSPTSITITWHASGAYENVYRVQIEGQDAAIWPNEEQNQARSYTLTELEPGTRYCLTVDAVYRAPQTEENDQGFATSSSERKCFSTRK